MSGTIRQRGQQLIKRVEGCFVGLAVGDALGSPLEDSTVDEINARFGVVDEMLGGGRLGLSPGQTTDETALAEMTADSIAVCGGFNPDDIAVRLADWLLSEGRGAGYQTSTVLSKVAAGEDWEQTALEFQADSPGSARKGSLARCAPIALLCHNDARAVIRASRVCCRITHPHADCQWASAFLNVIISELLDGQGKYEALGQALKICAEYGNASREVMSRAVRAAGHGSCRPASSAHVLDVLECSLWAWLHHGSFEEALVAAVNLGGGTDTIGALTGALSGCTYGIDSIPRRWLIYIRNRERLLELADTVTGIC